MDLVRCDNCKTEGPESRVAGWMRLETYGIATITFGESPGPWHFCSRECLGAWARGH